MHASFRVLRGVAASLDSVVSHIRRAVRTGAGVTLVIGPSVFLGACTPLIHLGPPEQAAPPVKPEPLQPYAEHIPVAAFNLDMIPIPASADGILKPFWISKTEIPWEAFDVYAYRLDEEAGQPKVDAVTRPSKPYLPPDRGFGHEGYAAISMSFKNASEFCVWLSKKTGKNYRLPTEAEWEHAARAGGTGSHGLSVEGTAFAAALREHAWFDANSDESPHPIGKKKPNPWGLHDMLGNVQEWVTGRDGQPVTKGGSYRDDAEALAIAARVPQTPAWNASDPQIPKSAWWLSDGPFVGFRIVCEPSTVKYEEKKP
ncbi:MAG: hypothetical protein HBSAPP03_23650 [Phycisphaerae bacterium]|nr:MAG: hypothetical protein HBSAPP03_23650 [Phycisphaerae bacterium]